MENILVIGCAGQIGSELTLELRRVYGNEHVFATDIRQAPEDITSGGQFFIVDVMDKDGLVQFIEKHRISQVYHLAAVLSGNAEKKPLLSWNINMQSLMNILEIARENKNLRKIFWPSSIAVFGPNTPVIDTPQMTIMDPNTVYGISKLAGERWCEYYFSKYGTDVRSIRYPGLISYKTEAGGGTTDYAVEIYYEAIRHQKYQCFLEPDTTLPMMFMSDAIKATIDLMEADASKLSTRSAYNIAGMSFNPAQVAAEIKKHIPAFEITYQPDFRQAIANSWPKSINAGLARKDWNFSCKHDLQSMTTLMLTEIKKKLS